MAADGGRLNASSIPRLTIPLSHSFRFGQKPTKVVFMSENSSFVLGTGSHIDGEIDPPDS